MSEELKEVTEEKSNALMDALFNAAESEPAPPPQAPTTKTRSLAEVMRASEAGELSSPEPKPEQEAAQEPSVDIAKRQVELVKPEEVRPVQQPVQQVVQQPVQQPAPVQPAEPEPDFLPEQMERLRLAKLAEQMYKENPQSAPPEYKDMHSKYMEYYTKESKYAAKAMEDGRNLEYDDEYANLRETLDPGVSDTILKSLERESIKREIGSELREQRMELARLKHQVHMQNAVPKVQEKVKSYVSENFNTSVPEEYRNELKELGREEFARRRPFEYEVIQKNLSRMNGLVNQFESIAGGVEQYDPNKHRDLAVEIEAMGQAHKKVAKSRNGKTFVTRDEFVKLPPHLKENHYTWNPNEVKDVFIRATGARINSGLKEVQAKVASYTNGSAPRPKPQEVAPTPRTATPKNPSPPTTSEQPEKQKSALTDMLLS